MTDKPAPGGPSAYAWLALGVGAALIVGVVGWCGGEPAAEDATRGAAVEGAGAPAVRPMLRDMPKMALPENLRLEAKPLPPDVERRRRALQAAGALAQARRAQLAPKERLERVGPLAGQPEKAPGTPPPADPPPEPRGHVPAEEVKAAIRAVIPAVKDCYEGGLKMKADSQGALKVSFTLVAADGGGFMRDAEIVDSQLGNPVVDACVLNALATARFPMPEGDGEVRVTYPFKFSQDAP
ncbi:MAG: AgmX/PglI C-terminal domain-containing protein [Deltaproteobacteria bacterium]|nr:AgmX/PglI C-terminal domain-containing protein [Deltaproteobacteria bacterium]